MRRQSRRLIALLAGLFVAAGIVLLALGGRVDPPQEKRSATPTASPAATRAPAAPAVAPVRVPGPIRDQIAAMTREQQIAQLFLVGFEGTDATVFAALRERGWGGLILTTDNVLSPDQGAVLAGEALVGEGVKPFVAALDVPGFEPPAQSPSDTAADTRSVARAQAVAWRAMGITLVFAPRADVGIADDDGTFGDDPDRVAALADAAARGWRGGGMIPAPGRFPGEGAASQDPLEGPSTVGLTVEELAERDLVPWRRLVRNAPAVVVSSVAFAAYDPVTPAVLTPAIVQGLLRDALGFTGVALSDELAGVTAATGGTMGEAAVEALRAGVDMVQIGDPVAAEEAYRAVLRAKLPAARLREALVRVLTLKRRAGLFGGAAAE